MTSWEGLAGLTEGQRPLQVGESGTGAGEEQREQLKQLVLLSGPGPCRVRAESKALLGKSGHRGQAGSWVALARWSVPPQHREQPREVTRASALMVGCSGLGAGVSLSAAPPRLATTHPALTSLGLATGKPPWQKTGRLEYLSSQMLPWAVTSGCLGLSTQGHSLL